MSPLPSGFIAPAQLVKEIVDNVSELPSSGGLIITSYPPTINDGSSSSFSDSPIQLPFDDVGEADLVVENESAFGFTRRVGILIGPTGALYEHKNTDVFHSWWYEGGPVTTNETNDFEVKFHRLSGTPLYTGTGYTAEDVWAGASSTVRFALHTTTGAKDECIGEVEFREVATGDIFGRMTNVYRFT